MSFTIKKLAMLILTSALFCGVAGYADAKGNRGDGASRYMEQLTPDQQKQAKAIFDEAKGANRVLREEISSKRAELAEIMKSQNPDTGRIEALSKELGQLRGKEMITRLTIAEKLKNSGLPEMKKPAKNGKQFEGKKGDKQEFVNKRIARLPEEKRAQAKELFDEYQAATAQTREALKTNRADFDKAMETGDAAAVEALSATMGELQGKLLVAKTELRQNLAKSGIAPDTFDRDVKKGDKPGKRDKDGRRGKSEI